MGFVLTSVVMPIDHTQMHHAFPVSNDVIGHSLVTSIEWSVHYASGTGSLDDYVRDARAQNCNTAHGIG